MKSDLYWNKEPNLTRYCKRDLNHYRYEIGEEHKYYKRNKEELVWNVFLWYSGSGLVIWNVFESDYIRKHLFEIKEHHKNLRAFSAALQARLSNHYASRIQWEISIDDYPAKQAFERIDVMDQVLLNWDQFTEYVWKHKKLITKDWVKNYKGYWDNENLE